MLDDPPGGGDVAHDGDTIRIAPGTYAGGVVVNRSVRLAGSGAGRTMIRGGGPVLTLGGATISISDLTIKGGLTTTTPQPGVWSRRADLRPRLPEATALGGGIEALRARPSPFCAPSWRTTAPAGPHRP
jgi:nitrous oxidase accessory protein